MGRLHSGHHILDGNQGSLCGHRKKDFQDLEALSVTLWLVDEKEEGLALGASTVLTDIQAKGIESLKREGKELIRAMCEKQVAVDLRDSSRMR